MPNRSRNDDDPNVTAHRIVSEATREDEPAEHDAFVDLIRQIRDALNSGEAPGSIADRLRPKLAELLAADLGRRGGKKGGRARAEALSDERRSEIAKKAAEARWAKARKMEEGAEEEG